VVLGGGEGNTVLTFLPLQWMVWFSLYAGPGSNYSCHGKSRFPFSIFSATFCDHCNPPWLAIISTHHVTGEVAYRLLQFAWIIEFVGVFICLSFDAVWFSEMFR
jgi:hypothetical protein